jgi:hypothetical protein
MSRVGRIHPPNRQVLKDISLGFYFGAKIGAIAGPAAAADDGKVAEAML